MSTAEAVIGLVLGVAAILAGVGKVAALLYRILRGIETFAGAVAELLGQLRADHDELAARVDALERGQ